MTRPLLTEEEKYQRLRARAKKNSRAFRVRNRDRIARKRADDFAALPLETQERIRKNQRAYGAKYRSKRAEYLRQHREELSATEEGRETLRSYARNTRERFRELLASIKSAPCQDCGGRFHTAAMEFDHIDPKSKHFHIAGMAGFSRERLLLEASKCDLVCANCHRVRESRRRKGVPAPLPPSDYEI